MWPSLSSIPCPTWLQPAGAAVMSSWLTVCCALCLALVLCTAVKLNVKPPTWKLHFNVHYAVECPVPRIMDCVPMRFKYTKSGDLVVNNECTVTKDVKEMTEALFSLTRCRDAVSHNTCEYYHTFRWTVRICDMLTSTVMPWPTIWHKWRPHMDCPSKAGNYTLKDARLHVPDASAMVIEWPGYVWIGNASMTTDQGLFMCKQFQFHVTRIRS